jgi:hypothetical protein
MGTERKTMRVLVIDPRDRTVHERSIPKTKEAIINAIGNGCIDCKVAHMYENGDVMYIDDNPYASEKKSIGSIIHISSLMPVMSRAVIVGTLFQDHNYFCDSITEPDDIKCHLYEEFSEPNGTDKDFVTVTSMDFILVDKRDERFIQFTNSL